MRVEDGLGRRVELPAPPRRVVSLVPSLTELLAALGLDEEVVGLTTFCVRPPGWRARKTRVGGTKDVRLARVRSLAPDLVLANKEENQREQVLRIAAERPVYVSDVGSLEAALAMVRAVGVLVGRAARADALAGKIEAGFAALDSRPRRRVAYLIWRDPLMAVGGDTFISDVLARGGLRNVFAERSRYPTIDLEALRRAAPEQVLLSSEPFPFRERHRQEFVEALPGVSVDLVDGQLFSWYGSRLLETPAALRRLTDAGFSASGRG
ncbi:MAG: cobalamin-binding protein [Planctomycetota bacterium]|nr:MAG: cobalamin-binding protein [Planctomycetota bacterium]